MTIRENGKERRISKQRALVKSQMARALKGNDRAAAKIIELVLKVTGLDEDDGAADAPLADDERAIMEEFVDRMRRRSGLASSPSGEADSGSHAKDADDRGTETP